MAKEYSKMTAAERLQDRMAKNRQIDERLFNPQGNWTLEAIVARLNKHHVLPTVTSNAKKLF